MKKGMSGEEVIYRDCVALQPVNKLKSLFVAAHMVFHVLGQAVRRETAFQEKIPSPCFRRPTDIPKAASRGALHAQGQEVGRPNAGGLPCGDAYVICGHGANTRRNAKANTPKDS